MELYLLHPVAVHFPIALLCAGALAFAFGLRPGAPEWLGPASSWLLWLGTAGAWLAFGLGLLAEETAPHMPAAWKTLLLHERLAYASVFMFTGLSFWRWSRPRELSRLFFAFWCAALIVLLATGYQGGRLVFEFAMGVRLPG